MTIDNTPAIRAFVEERLSAVKSTPDALDWRDHVIDELELILKLCDGLAKQQEMIYDAFGGAGRLVEK